MLVPVGANLPASDLRAPAPSGPKTKMRVAVYAVTAGNEWEVEQVRYALSEAKRHFEEIELVMMGRGTEVYGSAYVQALRGSGVNVIVRGYPAGPRGDPGALRFRCRAFARGGLG